MSIDEKIEWEYEWLVELVFEDLVFGQTDIGT